MWYAWLKAQGEWLKVIQSENQSKEEFHFTYLEGDISSQTSLPCFGKSGIGSSDKSCQSVLPAGPPHLPHTSLRHSFSCHLQLVKKTAIDLSIK